MEVVLFMMMVVVAVPGLAAPTSSGGQTQPTGLLVDYKKSPALGVNAVPRFSWIVPPCNDGTPDHNQISYEIKVSLGSTVVWDSGMIQGNDSIYVAYTGSSLSPGTSYTWTVTTVTAGPQGTPSCTSAPSEPGTFVTALFNGFSNATTSWISVPGGPTTFGYFRNSVQVPADVVAATAFVTAKPEDPLLCAYKLYMDSNLVSLGPGRGEAPVWGGDGNFRKLPYYSVDVSEYFVGSSTKSVLVAIEAMNSKGAQALLQINFQQASGKSTSVGTSSDWLAFNGDPHRNPGKSKHGGSAGTGFIEYIDARSEPVGWITPNFVPDSSWKHALATALSAEDISQLHAKMQPPMFFDTYVPVARYFPLPPGPPPPAPPAPPAPPGPCQDAKENSVANIGCPNGETISSIEFASFGTPTGSCQSGFQVDPKCNSNHSMEVVSAACLGKSSCSIPATCSEFHEQLSGKTAFCWDIVKYLAVNVSCKPNEEVADSSPTFFGDFGREFQGGLRLEIGDGVAGQTVHIACGEAFSKNQAQFTWGWEFDWVLRDGPQVLEQHKYMECRFVTLSFNGTAPSNVTLSSWQTHYPYDPSDSKFSSSNETLNAVYELCRYTLEAASLDTYTDSNTRERRPYEADGIIAATGRLMIQRDYLWPRHSHAWVIANPTWPVEWQQISPFLGWQDYMATGQPDLTLAFLNQMYERTKIEFLDNSTGVLLTSKMGRHIVDWMPGASESDSTVALGEFTASNHMFVSNGFAVRGLEMLATMLTAAGASENATSIAAQASSLRQAVMKLMWNGTNFCDGICTEVDGNSRMMSNMFSLCFGLVPEANIANAWNIVSDWGLEKIGDYGAFWYQMALASGYYSPSYATPGDGTAILTALTKCDQYSWCSGLLEDNLTMTRESWHDGTYSHEWGTSAIVGVVWGLMGIHQTSPAYASFSVMPKLGSLEHASITLPTIRGYINVSASPSMVEVEVPCGSSATLCLARSEGEESLKTPLTHTLLLDGNHEVETMMHGEHLCAAKAVGCGGSGVARTLEAKLR